MLKTFTGSGAGALKEPTGVAVDSSGNLWVAGNNRIVELDSSGAPVEVNGKPVEIESEGVESVALDGHGDVFADVDNGADPCGEKGSPASISSSTARKAGSSPMWGRAISEYLVAKSARFYSMVAVDEANGRVYVSDGQKNTVWVFGPPRACGRPGAHRRSRCLRSEARRAGEPRWHPASYRFEYGPTSAYGSSTPFPEGSVGEGLESHAVWASANGLAPGTTYHYRVVAINELAAGSPDPIRPSPR